MNDKKLHKLNELKQKIDELDDVMMCITNKKTYLNFNGRGLKFISKSFYDSKHKEIEIKGNLKRAIFKIMAIQQREYKDAFANDNANIGDYNIEQHVLTKDELEEYKMLKQMFNKA